MKIVEQSRSRLVYYDAGTAASVASWDAIIVGGLGVLMSLAGIIAGLVSRTPAPAGVFVVPVVLLLTRLSPQTDEMYLWLEAGLRYIGSGVTRRTASRIRKWTAPGGNCPSLRGDGITGANYEYTHDH